MNKIRWMDKFIHVIKQKKSLMVGVLVSILYLFIYLISIEHLFLSNQQNSFFVVNNPLERMFLSRAPFMWEPIASMSFSGIGIFLSPLNIILGGVLGILVGANIMISVFSYKFRKICNLNSNYSLIGVLPSMLSGFACCAPTFVIALAPALASFTVSILYIQPFLIPFSIIIMLLGLIWSVSRLPI